MSETYDIKIYENNRERETIRNLSYAQMHLVGWEKESHEEAFKILKRKAGKGGGV